MTKLSVNVNKIATLRNARGGNTPNVLEAALNIEKFGAQGITVHPRPDERHIRYRDVRELAPQLNTEFNIEGYPSPSFLKLVQEVQPRQVTLVPDPPGVLTSNAGWDTEQHFHFLKSTIELLHSQGIRTSLFMECDARRIDLAAATGVQRIELYTESYAREYAQNPDKAVSPYVQAARQAQELGLGINAGHDLNRENLQFFARHVPALAEVSIGHALIADALYLGLVNAVQIYLRQLELASIENT